MSNAGGTDQTETDDAGPLSQLKTLFGMNRGSAEFGVKQMSRAQLAREFDIEAIRFEPYANGVVEIGRAPQQWDAVLKRKFDEATDEGFEPAYAMFWELNEETSEFEIVADYVTDVRRKVLRAKRGDDVTFCEGAHATQPRALPPCDLPPCHVAYQHGRCRWLVSLVLRSEQVHPSVKGRNRAGGDCVPGPADGAELGRRRVFYARPVFHVRADRPVCDACAWRCRVRPRADEARRAG